MSCCWQPTTVISTGPGAPVPGPTGVIPLAAYPDCMVPYNLEHRADMAYLVGWSTPDERLFRSDQSGAAISYQATVTPLPLIDRVLLTSLCEQAVLDLYA